MGREEDRTLKFANVTGVTRLKIETDRLIAADFEDLARKNQDFWRRGFDVRIGKDLGGSLFEAEPDPYGPLKIHLQTPELALALDH